ncbi:TPA: ead/Ea22-like family protein [Enterobacter hormaechei subsp. xiangfangensis]|uniref:Ead/Ea22-like family protein n=1 Tax=Enterobacter hormaechei TaxID=158836 RepID=A0AAE9BGQ2_9ENTR|nr:ead/Ea22-like family protein [Enterobacter hormaechei]TYS06777.1 ead/Ea22-like family protein [Enterobacter hormaechei]HBM7627595.1 ead/Ea22-like family protein [Enterobacter hormaechei subsp. xiangfangensis]
MRNIDKRALREAAEKATKGQWAVEFNDEIYSTDGVNHEQIAMVFSENEARDAAFIAAANPPTVLALLDELEAKDKQIAELETREVILPQRMDPEGYHIDEAYMVAAEDGEYLDRDEVIEAMRTAGIRINGEG